MTFFSALALADLEHQWIRLRAKDQRCLLGCVPFGRCAIWSDGSSVYVFRSVCFGTDYETTTFTAPELAQHIAARKTARPGVYQKLKE